MISEAERTNFKQTNRAELLSSKEELGEKRPCKGGDWASFPTPCGFLVQLLTSHSSANREKSCIPLSLCVRSNVRGKKKCSLQHLLKIFSSFQTDSKDWVPLERNQKHLFQWQEVCYKAYWQESTGKYIQNGFLGTAYEQLIRLHLKIK